MHAHSQLAYAAILSIWNTFGAAIGYSSGKNNSSLKTPPIK